MPNWGVEPGPGRLRLHILSLLLPNTGTAPHPSQPPNLAGPSPPQLSLLSQARASCGHRLPLLLPLQFESGWPFRCLHRRPECELVPGGVPGECLAQQLSCCLCHLHHQKMRVQSQPCL